MALPFVLYTNVFESNTVVATTTAVGYSAQSIKDWRTYTYWQGTTTAGSTQYLTIDCGADVRANAIGIIGHNLDTASAVISVEHSSNNFVAVATALTTVAMTADTIYLTTFTEATNRYWRLKIVSPATGTAPKIAVCCLGTKTDFPTSPNAPVEIYSIDIASEGKLSKTGALLGAQVRYKPVTVKYKFSGGDYTYTWVNSYYKPFWVNHAADMKPFFFSLNSTVFTDAQWLMRLGKKCSYSPEMLFYDRVEEFTVEFEGNWGE